MTFVSPILLHLSSLQFLYFTLYSLSLKKGLCSIYSSDSCCFPYSQVVCTHCKQDKDTFFCLLLQEFHSRQEDGAWWEGMRGCVVVVVERPWEVGGDGMGRRLCFISLLFQKFSLETFNRLTCTVLAEFVLAGILNCVTFS